jgi:hypothetical protein
MEFVGGSVVFKNVKKRGGKHPSFVFFGVLVGSARSEHGMRPEAVTGKTTRQDGPTALSQAPLVFLPIFLIVVAGNRQALSGHAFDFSTSKSDATSSCSSLASCAARMAAVKNDGLKRY